MIAIPGLTYGRTGAFTINFWMRKQEDDTVSGPSPEGDYDSGARRPAGDWQPPVYEYMLTHANLQPLSPQASRWSSLDRNQVKNRIRG
jgi:hypothetical protein